MVLSLPPPCLPLVPALFLPCSVGRPRLVATALHALSFNKNTAVENVKGVATRPLRWNRCARKEEEQEEDEEEKKWLHF